ncbi:selenocysteine-specific translation elongation factor [Denitratisoma sp. DHT3]|uniref:selenocysteine-specific translation elongation factor n=1 Tax=Denitratisoma sp. DHT3 TaxID=1981880 RepID=UPI001198A5FF|nr:selenocysteine-specific translation elongation factor [Denitratisoma sp. DHT3]QDX80696.1 selenocysteine-specific translation elongation factor [Denitratisoma sp. DHT3]
MIVGTAGHIDHGKTTLVKALSGIDTDRLPEEKARGITLDLGYAYTDDGLLGYVDAPGHEKLVHTMLAGATGIDFLLLAVAADDGPMPQTREHLAIASLLGLTRGAVALTKIDAASPERLAAAHEEVAALLAGTPLASAPVFPVAARTGEGVAALRRHLLEVARGLGETQARGGFRLAIDRVFTLSGIGLVVTGTAFSGRVGVGDTVTLTPPGLTARVRGLHVHNRAAQTGQAGQRIALNLAGDLEKRDLARGMWVVAPALHRPVQRFQCRLRALEPLRHWLPVHVHLGAADVTGRLALLEDDTLLPEQPALAEIVLDKAVGVLAHDRLVLRDQSATRTIAGGLVLDVFPPTRCKRTPERLAMLRLLAEEDPLPALRAALERAPAGVDLGRYAANRNLDDPQALWRRLGLTVVEEGGQTTGFTTIAWQALGARLEAALAEEHQRAPDMIGVERERLRRLTLPTLGRAAFVRLVAELLATGRLAQSGGWLHRPEHRATLAAADAESWRRLRPQLEAAPFQPPRVRDLARATGMAEEAVRGLMRRVARLGLAYPVAHDHYFSAGAVAQLAAQVDALCIRDGAVRAAALRDCIGGGRKVAIHILEFFDRVGYTRRVKDAHVRRGAKDSEAARQWVLS